MKKFIVLSIFLTLSYLAHAQIDTLVTNGKDMVINALTDSGKLTAKMVYDDTKAGIIGLAKALKSPVEHVYKVLVTQQVVEAITDLIMLILGSIFFFTGIKASKSAEKWWWEKSSYDNGPTMLGIMRCAQLVIGTGFTIYGLCNIGNIVGGFVNPEYGAIKDIFEFVRGSNSTPQ